MEPNLPSLSLTLSPMSPPLQPICPAGLGRPAELHTSIPSTVVEQRPAGLLPILMAMEVPTLPSVHGGPQRQPPPPRVAVCRSSCRRGDARHVVCPKHR